MYTPVLWVVSILCLNLLMVVLLRLSLRRDTGYRTLGQMDFIVTVLGSSFQVRNIAA